MYLSIVFLPLLGSIIAGFFGRYLGKNGASLITTSLLAVSFLESLYILNEVGFAGSPCYLTLSPWIHSGTLALNWEFLFDSLTASMLVLVTAISTSVHMYSTGYMSEDPHLPRFMSYLSLFTFFMLFLVTAGNFIQLFVGWEGVGLCSYLLINFWYTRMEANQSALKAMIVNRIGDFGLLVGILTIFYFFQSFDFSVVFSLAPLFAQKSFIFFNMPVDILTLISLFLFVGVMGKSAQLGLHTWLPDAMEGPTPVSALIHAATMVTAGVFLLLRCSPLLEHAPVALTVITVFGAATAFFAATTGLVQNDLKKVIAYSTCSQLGYMVFACGISSYSISIFHLINHGFFKALLFLGAGCIIHAVADEQDMRRLGGLIKKLPFSYTITLIGSLSLMGFPFLTGYYSKDLLLEVAFSQYTVHGNFAHWLGTISACLTAIYSFRLIYLTFFKSWRGSAKVWDKVHEAPFIMAFPLILLSLASIFLGYFSKDFFVGLGSDFWNTALYMHPNNNVFVDAEFLPFSIKFTPVFLSILGGVLGALLYAGLSNQLFAFTNTRLGNRVHYFLTKKWYFDLLNNMYVGNLVLDIGYTKLFKLIDKGLIEHVGPYGLSRLVLSWSKKISATQTGIVYQYAFIMVLGTLVLVNAIQFMDTIFMWLDLRLILILLSTALYSNYFYFLNTK